MKDDEIKCPFCFKVMEYAPGDYVCPKCRKNIEQLQHDHNFDSIRISCNAICDLLGHCKNDRIKAIILKEVGNIAAVTVSLSKNQYTSFPTEK